MVRPATPTRPLSRGAPCLSTTIVRPVSLTCQNLPVFAREDLHADADGEKFASAEGVTRGAYVMADTESTPDVILIATGSEELAVAARQQLAEQGVAARVVSMPCRE